MKINKETKELARTIHRAEHMFVNGKIDKKHKLEDYYYLLGATVLTNVLDKKLEVGKIMSFAVDFTVPFNKWSAADGTVKALVPVTHKMEKKILWMNVKNPLYQEILRRGKAGQRLFKVLTTGTAKETRYALVEED